MMTLQQLNQNFSFTAKARARLDEYWDYSRSQNEDPAVLGICEMKVFPKDGSATFTNIFVGFYSRKEAANFPPNSVAMIDGMPVGFFLPPERYTHFYGRTLDVTDHDVFFLR